MGTKMAPCFTNLFMASIEQTFIDNSPLTPLFHVRFIDDILIIWTQGSEELEQFTTSLPFLDVLVSVTETGIKTSL